MTPDRRINFRVSDEEFHRWDDLRHHQRTSWQELGTKFFREWAAADPGSRLVWLPPGLTEEDVRILEMTARELANAGTKETVGEVRQARYHALEPAVKHIKKKMAG